jgi:hypothetical protein
MNQTEQILGFNYFADFLTLNELMRNIALKQGRPLVVSPVTMLVVSSTYED